MENHHLHWIFPLNILIFHSYVSHYQRVSDTIDWAAVFCDRFLENQKIHNDFEAFEELDGCQCLGLDKSETK